MTLKLLIVLSLGLIAGCNSQKGENKILTSNIFDRSELQVDFFQSSGSEVDLGEHLLTSPTPEISLKIRNNSSYPYTALEMFFSSNIDTPTALQFKSSPTGESVFPGFEGTCRSTLPPQQSCVIKLQLLATDQRLYLERVTLNFKNLVSDESQIVNLRLLAGMPASLVFSDEKTRFIFGTEIGIQKKPLVERESDEEFRRTLTIQNKGGLSARNITTVPVETCRSLSTLSCPPGMLGAYRFNSTGCPTTLKPNEECQVEVIFKPKNNIVSPPNTLEDIFEILYQFNLRFQYLSDTKDSVRNLNAFFDSNSANIQANFRSSSQEITFTEPVVGGNREKLTFQITNSGYREGFIKYFSFRDSDHSLIARCYKGTEGNLLDCFKPDDQPITLEQLPFKLADVNGCVDSKDETSLYQVNVDQGCLFELIFQPSAAHITNQSYEDLILTTTFDARWKDQRTIIERQLSLVSASSLAPGRLVVDTVNFAGTNFSNLNQTQANINLGRLTLQNPFFLKRRPLLIVLRNTGSIPTTLVSIRDGKNVNLPPGASTNLGSINPVYYQAVTPTNNCIEVPPNQTCQISMQFAAIGYPSNDDENNSMFDTISLTHGMPGGTPSYKVFSVNYTSGAQFTDTNFSNTPDYPARNTTARLTGILVRKGMLQELSDNPRNFSQLFTSTHQDELISYVFLQNIGTGTIPYIRLQRQFTNNYSQYIPTTNLAELGVDYDCLNIVDAPVGNVPFDKSPQLRISQDGASFAALGVGESCAFTIRSKLANSNFIPYPNSCLLPPTPLLMSTQAFGRITSGEWEPCFNINPSNNIITLAYFDGDLTNPTAQNSSYGDRFTIPNLNRIVQMSRVANLQAFVSTPFMTTLLHRAPINYPSLTSGPSGFTDPGHWFWDVTDMTLFSHSNSTAQPLFFVKAAEAISSLPTIAPLSTTKDSYDYYVHLGSFPVGSPAITSDIKLANSGGRRARVKNISVLTSPPASADFSITLPATPFSVLNGAELQIPFTLQTTSTGEKSMVIEYEYETSAFTTPLQYLETNNLPVAAGPQKTRTKRILITARISSSLPSLSAQVFNYDISQNVSGPPTVTLNPAAITAPMSLNTQPAGFTLAFDSIKLTSTTPTPQDIFDQKMIRYTNTSSSALFNFSVAYQMVSTSKSTLAPPDGLMRVDTTRPQDCNSVTTLSPGQSCDIIIRYQPLPTGTSQTITLAVIYSSSLNEYQKQNIALSLNPRSPGVVNLTLASNGSAVATETIFYKPTPASNGFNRTSHIFNIGTTQTMTSSPMVFSNVYRLSNTNSTKVSFLLSYHEHLRAQSLRGFTPESDLNSMVSVVPQNNEYENIGGTDYLTVFRTTYVNGDSKTVFQLSRGCFFGLDETNNAVPSHMKGFDNNFTGCFLRLNFFATFDFMLFNILNSNGDTMRQVAANLKYFSFNRSGRNESLWLHVRGQINPNVANATANSISGIESTDVPRRTSFIFPTFAAQTPGLGPVVGIRILRSTTQSGLNNVYATNLTNYIDIPVNGTLPTNVSFTTGFNLGTFYYYRAVAIRFDSRFTHSNRFVNLPQGHYLSQINNTSIFRILLPPNNHALLPDLNVIVEKTLATNQVTVDTFSQASSRCSSRSVTLSLQGANSIRSYALITTPAWTRLKSRPDATVYLNMLSIAHWLNDSLVTIDSQLNSSNTSGFISGQSSQYLEAAKRFYIRNSSNPAAGVRTVVGGVPGTTASDFISFVDPAVNFGSARCMATLP